LLRQQAGHEGARLMSDISTASELFRDGKLSAAIEAVNKAVRDSPMDFGPRLLLAELLIFAGNLQRADLILDAAAKADPTTAVIVAEFRQLLRADIARHQSIADGRVPDFIGEPTAALRAQLAARVALRAGDIPEAARQVADAEAARPRVAGVFQHAGNEVTFDDLRDADDLHAGFFEVLTTTGKYFWIPTERVATLELHPPKRPRDLAWRRAAMSVINGPDGEVYIPALYLSDETETSEDLRLGRATDWTGDDDGLVRGVGQRVVLIGDDAYGITDLSSIRFGE
jgi:type VI secretion system protein ImpE